MTFFHTHKFHEVERTFSGRVKAQHMECSEELVERLTMGVTTIIQQCSECGRLRTTEVIGNALGVKS